MKITRSYHASQNTNPEICNRKTCQQTPNDSFHIAQSSNTILHFELHLRIIDSPACQSFVSYQKGIHIPRSYDPQFLMPLSHTLIPERETTILLPDSEKAQDLIIPLITYLYFKPHLLHLHHSKYAMPRISKRSASCLFCWRKKTRVSC